MITQAWHCLSSDWNLFWNRMQFQSKWTHNMHVWLIFYMFCLSLVIWGSVFKERTFILLGPLIIIPHLGVVSVFFRAKRFNDQYRSYDVFAQWMHHLVHSRCKNRPHDFFPGHRKPFGAFIGQNFTPMCFGYRQTSNVTLVGNKLIGHSDVVGASSVGTAPTTSSFLT